MQKSNIYTCTSQSRLLNKIHNRHKFQRIKEQRLISKYPHLL